MNNLKRDLQDSIRNALNRAITRLKKEQQALIQDSINLSNKKINNLTKVKRATRENLKASINTFTKFKTISLNSFKKIRKTTGGIKVEVSKNKNIFIAGGFFIHPKSNKKKKIIVTRMEQKNKDFFTKSSNIKTFYTRKGTTYKKAGKTERSHKDLLYAHSKIKFPQIVIRANKTLEEKAKQYFQEELAK